jgi:purine-binding chemotaxis protein CheW
VTSGRDESGDERTRAILEARAAALARPPAPPTAPGVEVLVFELSGERYALETRYVREVGRLTDFVRVPGLPDFVTGVISVRGEIVAIIDVRRLVALPARGLSDSSRFVAVGEEDCELAIAADRVNDVTEIDPSGVQAPARAIGSAENAVLGGMTSEGWVLIDGRRLLHDPRLVIDSAEREARNEVSE